MIAVGTHIFDVLPEEAHLLVGCIVSLENTSWTIVATEDPPSPAWSGRYTILLDPLLKSKHPRIIGEDHPKFGRVRRIGSTSPSATACFILTTAAQSLIKKDPLARFLHI